MKTIGIVFVVYMLLSAGLVIPSPLPDADPVLGIPSIGTVVTRPIPKQVMYHTKLKYN